MAALDAVALRNCLRRALPSCPDDISAQRRNDWGDLRIAAGSDLAFPEMEGSRTPFMRITGT